MEPPGLHNRAQAPAVFGEQRDIVERIAIDDDEIRRRARHDAPEVRPAQYVGARDGRRAQDRRGRLNLPAIEKFAGLHVENIAGQVGAKPELGIGLPCGFEALQREMRDLLRLRRGGRRQTERIAALDERHHDREGRHREAAGVAERTGCFRGDQRRVFDRPHAELRCTHHRLGGMGVSGDITAPPRRFLDRRPHLIVGELLHPDRVGGRKHAAGQHDLDAMRPHAQFLARRAAYLVGAIDHMRDHMHSATSAWFDILVSGAQITMTTRHRERPAGIEQPRPRNEIVVDGPRQSVIAPTDIAQAGKSAIERMSQHPRRMRRGVSERMIEKLGHVGAGQPGMDMDVDQPRQQRATPHVDHLGVGEARRASVNRYNPALLDHHMAILEITVSRLVQDTGIFEQDHRQLAPDRSRLNAISLSDSRPSRNNRNVDTRCLSDMNAAMRSLRQSLPPLNALAVFEAAARHGSFTRAAAELNIAQSAVSRHVSNLEADLGVTLFVRSGNRLALTGAGETLADAIQSGLGRIRDTVEEIRRRRAKVESFTIACTYAIAHDWLMPRFGRLRAVLPKAQLRLITTDSYLNFDADDVDLSIRYGEPTDWPGLRYRKLREEEVFPVCAPAMLAEFPGLAEDDPDAWQRAPLLYFAPDAQGRVDWPDWFGELGIPAPQHGPMFSAYTPMLLEALAGRGVVLGWRGIVDPYLETGQLVRLANRSMVSGHAFYVVHRADAREALIEPVIELLLSPQSADPATS